MSRVILGHTGRNVFEPPPVLFWCFALLVCGALVRVVFPMFSMNYYPYWMGISQLLWIASFLVFLVVYTPMLFKTRIDGRDGWKTIACICVVSLWKQGMLIENNIAANNAKYANCELNIKFFAQLALFAANNSDAGWASPTLLYYLFRSANTVYAIMPAITRTMMCSTWRRLCMDWSAIWPGWAMTAGEASADKNDSAVSCLNRLASFI